MKECHSAADFAVYIYDLSIDISHLDVGEWYTRDLSCPLICGHHMMLNETTARGERRPGGSMEYAFTNRSCQIGYTKYVPLVSVHKPLRQSVSDVSFTWDRVESWDPEAAVLEAETRGRVRETLRRMPARDSEILRLVYLEEANRDEICKRLGVDRQYFRVMVHRALKRFRTEYNAESKPLSQKSELALNVLYASVNEELVRRLARYPELVRHVEPRKFEELVADIFARRGCAVALTPATRDGGVDIYALENADVGKSLYVIECKRYGRRQKVGVEPVRGLYAVTEAVRATKGILVTTSSFTKDAIAFASPLEFRLALADFEMLSEWLNTYA